MKKYLETGKIVGTHGIKGEVRVQPWCDSGEFLCDFDVLYTEEGKTPMKVLKSRVNKNVVIIQFDGINSIEEADSIRGEVLYIDRDDVELPEGSYFIQDLIGLEVYDVDNERYYGKLTDVSATGANDVYHITSKSGVETLIAAVPSVVIETDINGGIMKIRPLGGTFEDED